MTATTTQGRGQQKSRVKEKVKKIFSKRQWATLFAIGSFHFSSAICISLQAPFYPEEAEKKGASATEYGLVFGSFELVAFLSSPIFGKYLHKMGEKTAFSYGIIVASVSSILFGLLDLVNSHIPFITLSFILRMLESLGSTAALVAAFSLTALVFSDRVATVFAILEIFYGLGYIVGPALGSLLFSVGGYITPFAVMGLTMSFVGIVICVALPPSKARVVADKPQSIYEILKVPGVLLDSIAVACTSVSSGFYSATLEPHIRIFKLTTVQTGLMFVLSGGTYAIVAPFVGKLCDKHIYPKKLIIFGSFLIICSYMLVGPAPFLKIPTTLSLCIIGLIIHGVGVACLFVPTFIDSIASATESGFSDDITTYGLISGLWSSSFALGSFIGPSVAGVLFDLVGFRRATLFVVGTHVALFVGVLCFVCFETRPTLRRPREGSYSSTSSSSVEDCMESPLLKVFQTAIIKETLNGGPSKSYGSIINEEIQNGMV